MVQQHVPAQSRHLELGGLWIWAESSSSQVLPSQAITVRIFSVFCSYFSSTVAAGQGREVMNGFAKNTAQKNTKMSALVKSSSTTDSKN